VCWVVGGGGGGGGEASFKFEERGYQLLRFWWELSLLKPIPLVAKKNVFICLPVYATFG